MTFVHTGPATCHFGTIWVGAAKWGDFPKTLWKKEHGPKPTGWGTLLKCTNIYHVLFLMKPFLVCTSLILIHGLPFVF